MKICVAILISLALVSCKTRSTIPSSILSTKQQQLTIQPLSSKDQVEISYSEVIPRDVLKKNKNPNFKLVLSVSWHEIDKYVNPETTKEKVEVARINLVTNYDGKKISINQSFITEGASILNALDSIAPSKNKIQEYVPYMVFELYLSGESKPLQWDVAFIPTSDSINQIKKYSDVFKNEPLEMVLHDRYLVDFRPSYKAGSKDFRLSGTKAELKLLYRVASQAELTVLEKLEKLRKFKEVNPEINVSESIKQLELQLKELQSRKK